MSVARLNKLFKIKPIKKLELEPVPEATKETVEFVPERAEEAPKAPVVVPEPTEKELKRWAAARKHLQQNDKDGQPVEGWKTRIELMKADGRLWYCEEDGLWHRRGV